MLIATNDSVIQRSSKGIIVEHRPLVLTGYILPRNDVDIEKGIIKQVSVPEELLIVQMALDRIAEAFKESQ